jgi:hypothetical protein
MQHVEKRANASALKKAMRKANKERWVDEKK